MPAPTPRASADVRSLADGDRRLATLLDAAIPFRLPLARPFRGVDAREGLLLQGPHGWGEFAPFIEYDAAVAARWLMSAVEAGWGQWPEPVRSEIPVNGIVPAVAPDVAYSLAHAACSAHGCATMKVKVAERGQGLPADVARVAAVRRALDDCGLASPQGRIRIDANGAWGVDDAVAAVVALDDAAGGLEYAEQPCAGLDELAAVRGRIAVPIAADESIRIARDPATVVAAAGIDVAVIKVPPLGGVSAAISTARACGVTVVVSGAMDSAVGLGAGLACAAALPEAPPACGLGTGMLLKADVTAAPWVPSGGILRVGRAEPDPTALQAATGRMPGPRRDWWMRRLARAWITGANQYAGRWLDGMA